MKKATAFLIILFLILFSLSCSKKNDGGGSGEKKISIAVVEYKTDSPIVGALVEYYKLCPICQPAPGYNIVLSDRSGFGGICEIPESIFNNGSYGILITPPSPPQDPSIDYSYYAVGSPGVHSTARTYFLPVVGEEKLHLVKTGSFPKGYYMELKAHGEQASFDPFDIARVYAFPSDTSFSFYTYRGQTNTITWNIYDSTDHIISSGGPVTVEFPKRGIQELELKY
jgi:hypothetical protein